MNNVLEKKFHLVKLELKDGAIKYEAVEEKVVGSETYSPVTSQKYPIEPHPDMFTIMDKLKRPFAELMGMIDSEWLVSGADFKATNIQKQFSRKCTESKLMDIGITGVKISGEGINRGISIEGVYNKQKIKTKHVRFSASSYGFEEDLMDIAEMLNREVFRFVYEDKRAQSEIIFTDGPVSPIDGTGSQFEKETSSKTKKNG